MATVKPGKRRCAALNAAMCDRLVHWRMIACGKGHIVDPIVEAFGAALVAAMATDTWKEAKAAVLALWHRVRPGREGEADAELERLRERVITALQARQPGTGQALEGIWQGRLQELLLDDPGLAGQLQEVLDGVLVPMLVPAERSRISQMIMTGSVGDGGTVNQVAGDQYNIQLPSPPSPPLAFTLPGDLAGFVGRHAEVEDISRAVAAVAHGPAVTVVAIDGMPGVGKTTLAVHAAHLMSGQFPDRLLFVDLRAHAGGQRPADPGVTLAGLLAADGAGAPFIPGDLESRAAMWRDRLAGKRVLLVLDDAASTEQVAPLLPGSPGSVVLITSRRYLGDLPAGVMTLSLDIPPLGDAAQIFLSRVPRAAGEPAKVREVVELCGRLPMAITLVARVHAKHRSWEMDDLIAVASPSVLLATRSEKQTIAAAIGLSLQDLSPAQQRFFRLLGQYPGADTDAYAAAALSGLPTSDARQHLDGLHFSNLLTEPVPHRYRMHDLVRDYARSGPGAAPETRDALRRVLGYYLHTAQDASARLEPWSPAPAAPARPAWPGLDVPELPDRSSGLAWMRAERSNLLACARTAASHDEGATVTGLSAALAAYLRTDGSWSDALTLHMAAASAARRLGDRRGQADALARQSIRGLSGDIPGAADALSQALDLYRDLGDRSGEAQALTELGAIRRLQGDYAGAAALTGSALDIFQDLGDRHGQATALHNLGVMERVTGNYPAAAALQQRSLDISLEVGDQQGQAASLSNLGMLRYLTDDFPGAADLLGRALAIFRARGDRLAEANCLNNLGTAYRLAGDLAGAEPVLGQALAAHRALGNKVGQANCLSNLAAVHKLQGDLPGAAAELEEARDLYLALGHRLGHANALTDLGAVRALRGDDTAATLVGQGLEACRNLGDTLGLASALSELAAIRYRSGRTAEAQDLLDQALRSYGDLGDQLGRTEVLNHLGKAHLVTGDMSRAAASYEQALRQARAIHSQLEEARALEGLGKSALQLPGSPDAYARLAQALEIYQRIGAAEGPPLAAELGTLNRG
jgi:tetratricopeptide (TPR) repeat protein